ncbi:MAG: hypothetical protein JSV00_00845 [bacterium]|nr:MAG: hypothetical protein JSV00_00845 [bacterium]
MTTKPVVQRKRTVASVLLVLTAMLVLAVSDYRTAMKTLMIPSETYAQQVAGHMGRLLTAPGEKGLNTDLASPGALLRQEITLEGVARNFGLLNIRVYGSGGELVYAMEGDPSAVQVTDDSLLAWALEGKGGSHVTSPESKGEATGGFPTLETYVPIFDTGGSAVIGVFEISQDYRPIQSRVVKETIRSATAHVLLLFLFAALFYSHGRAISGQVEYRQKELTKDLTDRLEERTLELKRSRERLHDLTRVKGEMQRDLAIADEYKKNFLGLVSHELRTPLSVIKGYLTMLEEGVLQTRGPGSGDIVRTCLEESRKLETVINNILELSQLDRGVFDLAYETFPVGEMLQEALDSLGSEMAEKGIDAVIEVTGKAAVFTSDRLKILQVMHQFLSNAVKFSREGGKVLLRASPSHRGLLLAVSDEGVGIPAAKVSEIFNLFYQVDISTTRSYEGTGLGLAIVQKIARILGGRVWVESVEGSGSTFFFEVPASRHEEGKERAL